MNPESILDATINAVKSLGPAGNLLRRPLRCVVALSGGLDSSFLAVTSSAWDRDGRARVVLAHYGHCMRGEREHAADLRHVHEFAEDLSLPLLVEEAAVGEIERLAREERSGIEAAARSLRYRFLKRACRLTGSTLILTGHTADDQVETVMMRLLASGEPLNCGGIEPARREGTLAVVHPLLSLRKADIRARLEAEGVAWREDRTNADSAYLRNHVRLRVLPALRLLWPAVDHDALLLADGISRLRRRIDSTGLPAWHESDEGLSVDSDEFFALGPESRLISLYAVLERTRVVKAASRPSRVFFAPLLGPRPANGTVIASRGIRFRLSRSHLYLVDDVAPGGPSGYLRLLRPGKPLVTPGGIIVELLCGGKRRAAPQASVVHLGEVTPPVIVRGSREGDVLPTRCGRKQVSVLLAEAGINPDARSAVPLLVDRRGVLAVILSHIGAENLVSETLCGVRRDGKRVEIRVDE
jgi:tRNA(Ile)-lysidine synthase